jgi:hypothetical protein
MGQEMCRHASCNLQRNFLPQWRGTGARDLILYHHWSDERLAGVLCDIN